MLRIELEPSTAAPRVVRAFVAQIGRVLGVPEDLLADVRVAVSDLITRSLGDRQRLQVEISTRSGEMLISLTPITGVIPSVSTPPFIDTLEGVDLDEAGRGMSVRWSAE